MGGNFHGGMFCDEAGLGKTITALSLLLKTQGTLAEPPDGAQVIWCMHNGDQRFGYYELSGVNKISSGVLSPTRATGHNGRRGRSSYDKLTPVKSVNIPTSIGSMVVHSADHIAAQEISSPTVTRSTPTRYSVRITSSFNQTNRNLIYAYQSFLKRGMLGKTRRKESLLPTNNEGGRLYSGCKDLDEFAEALSKNKLILAHLALV